MYVLALNNQSGVQNAGVTTGKRLATSFGCNLDTLAFGSPSPPPPTSSLSSSRPPFFSPLRGNKGQLFKRGL